MAPRSSSKKPAAIAIKAGDAVLLGAPGVSMPGDWFVATVLLVSGDEVATVHEAPSGGAVRQFFPVSYVRAAGEYGALRDFQEAARAEVAELAQRVNDLTSQLSLARDAVWARLDDYAARRPGASNGR